MSTEKKGEVEDWQKLVIKEFKNLHPTGTVELAGRPLTEKAVEDAAADAVKSMFRPRRYGKAKDEFSIDALDEWVQVGLKPLVIYAGELFVGGGGRMALHEVIHWLQQEFEHKLGDFLKKFKLALNGSCEVTMDTEEENHPSFDKKCVRKIFRVSVPMDFVSKRDKKVYRTYPGSTKLVPIVEPYGGDVADAAKYIAGPVSKRSYSMAWEGELSHYDALSGKPPKATKPKGKSFLQKLKDL